MIPVTLVKLTFRRFWKGDVNFWPQLYIWKKCLWLPRLHLFDQKHSKNSKSVIYIYMYMSRISLSFSLSNHYTCRHLGSPEPWLSTPALRRNHSYLTSINESASPVATNQAHYITALNPDTHCLVLRLQAPQLSHHLSAVSLWMSSSSGLF